jgi:hypothetical protein
MVCNTGKSETEISKNTITDMGGAAPSKTVGKYDGDVDALGKKHGKGKYALKNGDTYSGDWKNDCMHGRGHYVYVKGVINK